MRLHFNAYLATTLVCSSLVHHVTADSIRGTRSASQTSSIEENSSNSRFLIPSERRLLPHEGVMRTLIIRVTDGEGKQPITDARRESDTWFGTHGLALAGNLNSMTGLYEQCSGGKLSFVPSTGPGVVDGVFELSVSQNMTSLHVSTAGQIARNEFNILNQDLGIEFENYSIILPMGVKGGGGLAQQRGNHQFYTSGADRSLELIMHEFGHTLGFQHSGLPNEGDYDDNSCLMGCCAGAQQMCFNAAKSWFSGWYVDGHVDLSHLSTPGQWSKVHLVGIDDYLKGVFGESNSFVAKICPGLYMLFNRKKGVNAGVKAYGDEVVIVQQWGEGGKSKVLAHLNDESNRRVEFNRLNLYTDFDIAVEVCDITFAPIITGPQIDLTGGRATQSSTAAGAEATRAIDKNLDQSWAGGSVTHTSGDEEDLDPWWELELVEAQEIQHVRIFNRNDCCGSRLSNAFLELYNDEGELTYKQNLGFAEDIKDVRFGESYLAKRVKIQLLGYKVLSLAEVQLFAPSQQVRQEPDYASVLVSVSDGLGSHDVITCDSTMAPSTSFSPSSNPTTSHAPTVYKAVPKDVVLLRDDVPCIFQSNPSHPDRFKCTLQPTTANDEPGDYGNAPVRLQGKDGCLLSVRPVTWSWEGNAFIFESSANLDDVINCFAAGVLLSEVTGVTDSPTSVEPSVAPSSVPTSIPSAKPNEAPSSAPSSTPTALTTLSPTFKSVIPNGVVLQRANTPCISQVNPSNHPDRFKCMIEPTTVSSDPGTYDNDVVALVGENNCILHIRPVTFAWEGNAFIFQSSESLEAINDCFAAGVVLSEWRTNIPDNVTLLRDNTPCIFQSNPSNHPDRFKCMLEPTAVSSEPGTYGNDLVVLSGLNGCIVDIRPVTWSWEGNALIFESTASLDVINDCFAFGVLISESVSGAAENTLFG